eukprot:TRINITY_DN3108_c0_g1_i2.p1 TRINITY_DN3108_c0_g1~~TRINITY_DN3108_c0_g1_i2.p1  ORF type:complete len:202 (+),score=43.58 TRINITY_DN3108_c0_g1_i2:92-697(+)
MPFFFFLMIRRPPRSTLSSSSAASDVYKRQVSTQSTGTPTITMASRSLLVLLTFSALAFAADLNCETDEVNFVSMTVTNPTVIKVKVKACDAVACQGNPLKPNPYKACGGPDDRVAGDTSKDLHFNQNTTYLVFSNGVSVKEFHKPTTGDWPATYRINVPGFSDDWVTECPGCSADPSEDACRLISGCCKCCAKPNPCRVM